MRSFRVWYTNGQHYLTNANSTAAEFEAYLKQDGGRQTFEDSNGKEFHLFIDRVEEVSDGRHWYKLQGTYRKAGAIGRVEPFTQIIKAENPRAAMDTNRQDLYDVGYDTILYLRVYTRDEDAAPWSRIAMMDALGLE